MNVSRSPGMPHRTFMAVIAGSLLARPRAAGAQTVVKASRIVRFHVGLDHVPPSLDGLRDGLKALGYEEGKNLQLDFRNVADEAAARVAAADLARARSDLLVAFENQTLRAAKAATSQIPVVFLHVTDPVAAGVAVSLAHPGRNMTRFIALGNAPSKEAELFKQLVPGHRRLLVLSDPDDPGGPLYRRQVHHVGVALKFQLVERDVRSQTDIERGFASLSHGAVDGVFIASLDLRVKFHALILRLASEQPKPADLPIEAYEHPELVINLKTAKTLGLTIPPALLQRADQVIE